MYKDPFELSEITTTIAVLFEEPFTHLKLLEKLYLNN